MKPHIYADGGRWFVSREGKAKARPLRDAVRPTFAEACQLAQLAAIHAGVWRR